MSSFKVWSREDDEKTYEVETVGDAAVAHINNMRVVEECDDEPASMRVMRTIDDATFIVAMRYEDGRPIVEDANIVVRDLLTKIIVSEAMDGSSHVHPHWQSAFPLSSLMYDQGSETTWSPSVVPFGCGSGTLTMRVRNDNDHLVTIISRGCKLSDGSVVMWSTRLEPSASQVLRFQDVQQVTLGYIVKRE